MPTAYSLKHFNGIDYQNHFQIFKLANFQIEKKIPSVLKLKGFFNSNIRVEVLRQPIRSKVNRERSTLP